MTDEPIASPCIRVCAVDGQSGWCLGCARTLAEIGGWSAYSPLRRAQVLDDLPRRMEILERSGLLGVEY